MAWELSISSYLPILARLAMRHGHYFCNKGVALVTIHLYIPFQLDCRRGSGDWFTVWHSQTGSICQSSWKLGNIKRTGHNFYFMKPKLENLFQFKRSLKFELYTWVYLNSIWKYLAALYTSILCSDPQNLDIPGPAVNKYCAAVFYYKTFITFNLLEQFKF